MIVIAQRNGLSLWIVGGAEVVPRIGETILRLGPHTGPWRVAEIEWFAGSAHEWQANVYVEPIAADAADDKLTQIRALAAAWRSFAQAARKGGTVDGDAHAEQADQCAKNLISVLDGQLRFAGWPPAAADSVKADSAAGGRPRQNADDDPMTNDFRLLQLLVYMAGGRVDINRGTVSDFYATAMDRATLQRTGSANGDIRIELNP